jgi:hypothetical protein
MPYYCIDCEQMPYYFKTVPIVNECPIWAHLETWHDSVQQAHAMAHGHTIISQFVDFIGTHRNWGVALPRSLTAPGSSAKPCSDTLCRLHGRLAQQVRGVCGCCCCWACAALLAGCGLWRAAAAVEARPSLLMSLPVASQSSAVQIMHTCGQSLDGSQNGLLCWRSYLHHVVRSTRQRYKGDVLQLATVSWRCYFQHASQADA